MEPLLCRGPVSTVECWFSHALYRRCPAPAAPLAQKDPPALSASLLWETEAAHEKRTKTRA